MPVEREVDDGKTTKRHVSRGWHLKKKKTQNRVAGCRQSTVMVLGPYGSLLPRGKRQTPRSKRKENCDEKNNEAG